MDDPIVTVDTGGVTMTGCTSTSIMPQPDSVTVNGVVFSRKADGKAVIMVGDAYIDEERLIALLRLIGIETGKLVRQEVSGVVTFDVEQEEIKKAVSKAVEDMRA